MFVKDRRSGTRSWIPGLFAGFWILLAVFSAAYLFRVVTDPATKNRVEAAMASPTATSAPAPAPSTAPPALSPEQASALLKANEAKDRELTELRSTVRDLSGQVAELGTRLKPLEKVLGPVAALTTSTSVTTSPPAPGAMRQPDPTPAPPAAVVAPPPPPVAAPKPPEPAKPSEKPPAQANAAAEDPPSGAAVTTGDPEDADSDSAEASTETAALAPPSSIPPGTTRFGIEIGAVDKQDAIRAMWRDLLTNHAALVAGLQARRVIAPDKKWRLIAGPFSSAAEAMQACGLFKKASMPCEATVFAGDAF
ncbi:MAG: SPOR domain-containing protein [Methyloceanibacter sp.]|jgi:hypothetical protein